MVRKVLEEYRSETGSANSLKIMAKYVNRVGEKERLRCIMRNIIAHGYTVLLDAEFCAHLGYEKSSAVNKISDNRRNGFIKKKIDSSFGKIELKVPRDRDGSFNPVVIRKHVRAASNNESKVLSIFLNLMDDDTVNSYLESLYSHDLSQDKIMEIQNRVIQYLDNEEGHMLKSSYVYAEFSRIAVTLNYVPVSEGDMPKERPIHLYAIFAVDHKGNEEVLEFFTCNPNTHFNADDMFARLSERGVKDIMFVRSLNEPLYAKEIGNIFPYAVIC